MKQLRFDTSLTATLLVKVRKHSSTASIQTHFVSIFRYRYVYIFNTNSESIVPIAGHLLLRFTSAISP
jgi:hypothetical protein